MPRKIRDLVRDLEDAGFTNQGGKGSHRKYSHPKVKSPVILSGHDRDDAKQYQERDVRRAIEESEQ